MALRPPASPDSENPPCATALLPVSYAATPMHEIDLLLPLYDNDGKAFTRADFDRVQEELTAQFGGVTAFLRAPATGTWREGGETTRDQMVVFEVLAETLDRAWWTTYLRELERRFRQEKILARATRVEVL